MTTSDEQRLEQWRDTWNQMSANEEDKITKEDAIECIKQNAQEPLSRGLIKALRT
eukprot:CAMPEP_0170459542 /NCGR_PEP_ID=MMETSP0123-20130129/6192_1 /TAXON_ID=182087 /ORGANISM="Favella ehrenbergii, Strain Fehren 1" /LENGTH=54 /DNA_ID=CAMNT_0010724155 /DNA_START=339 /DNA_END=503 /DNA_ORIENTATION=-